jgi:hypothetical protein
MLPVAYRAVATALITLAFVGCQEGADVPSAPPNNARVMSHVVDDAAASLVPRLVSPQATDAEITWVPAINPQINHHYVWLDPSEQVDRLFVFLPATGGRPAGTQLVQQEAARLGYHVIGLMYQNNVAVEAVCKGHPDRNCSRDLRLEVVDGIDRSSFVAVTPPNSIENRLTKLLLYLDAQFPDEGWSRFLKDGEPKWSKIVVGGVSQGAGHAAIIGTIRRVARVVMLAGPPDSRVPEEVDAWVSIGATRAVRYFALFHQRDAFGAGIRANLAAFGLARFGDPLVAELSAPQYGGTHTLVTDFLPANGSYASAHLSVVTDQFTPLGPDGTPLLRDAWRYLMGAHEAGEGEEQP